MGAYDPHMPLPKAGNVGERPRPPHIHSGGFHATGHQDIIAKWQLLDYPEPFRTVSGPVGA